MRLTLDPGFASTVQWTDDRFDAMAHEAVVSLGETVSLLANSRNLGLPFVNPNDARLSQNPLQSFGSNSVARLKATSIAYDPERVFQKQQRGGFLLGA